VRFAAVVCVAAEAAALAVTADWEVA